MQSMKTIKLVTHLGLGVAALGLGAGGTAQAVPYGFATNQIGDFSILVSGGTLTFAGGTQSTDNVATLTPGTSVSTTAPAVISSASDAAQAVVGTGPFRRRAPTFLPSFRLDTARGRMPTPQRATRSMAG
jgi:hypothetical protein